MTDKSHTSHWFALGLSLQDTETGQTRSFSDREALGAYLRGELAEQTGSNCCHTEEIHQR